MTTPSALAVSLEDLGIAVNSLFMLVLTLLLMVVVLGISIFYSGLIQRRSSFTMLAIPIMLSSLLFFDWFIWGYSLCYSPAKNGFIGNLNFAVLRHLRDPKQMMYSTPRGDIMGVIHFLFNSLMRIVCAVIAFPACTAERGRIMPMIVFVFCWATIIYNPVTYWFWNRKGWLSAELNRLPVLDFAGGNCIHIVSGFTALAYLFILGPRNPKVVYNYRSSNNSNMVIGMCFLLFGWCGFIAGCDYKFSQTTFFIITNTLLSAFCAGLVWLAIDYYFSATPLEGEAAEGQTRKLSSISFCLGVMCGLVVFTPAGGYLSSADSFWKSIVVGVIGGFTGNLATGLKYILRIDDSLDIFAVHGVCGIVGSVLVGFFASTLFQSKGGWVEHHWKQLGYQLLGCVVTGVYVFVLSLVFLYVIDMVPGLYLRMDKTFNLRSGEDSSLERGELMGSDWYEFNGEYLMDFMEFIKVLAPEDFSDNVSAGLSLPEAKQT